MKFLFTKEVENMKGYTRCETVAIENELGDFASEEMFLKIKEFLTEETDEKRHVFSNDNPTNGDRVFVEVLYSDDLDDITHSQTYDVKTGLHEDTGIIVERIDSERFQYVLPNDSMAYLDEVVFKDGLDWSPALDICCRGEEGEGNDITSEYFTHGKDGEIIELDDTSDFRYFVEDWKERLMDSVRTNFEEVIILED